MKIAISSQRASYYHGGTERYVLNMASKLDSFGEKITFISYDAPEKSKWFKDFEKSFKGEIILLKSKDLDKNFSKFKYATKPKSWDKESFLFSECSKKTYKERDFDVIVFHYAVDCLNAPENKKIYLHLHGLPDVKRKIENKAIKIPDKIIAVSNYIAKGWKKLHKIKRDIPVVYNGINLKQKIPKPHKEKNNILFFGRLIKIKGVDILLKATSRLLKKNSNLRIQIIGEGPEKKNIIKLAKKLGIEKNISFLGYVEDPILKKRIACSKVCVFPSYSREGVMTTLLEASLMKKPIIASNACSNPEYIKDGENGLLFKSKDDKDLAKKIEKLINNKKLREQLSKNVSKTIKNWSWEKQARKLIDIYKKI